MQMQNDNIKAVNLKELLSAEDEYIIPIYQRNYAWESKEIIQLIQDIIDYSIHNPNKNYYIGTLVVARENKDSEQFFNTIDGQQRLTTLSILSAVIKNNHSDVDMDWFQGLNLHYQSREKSTISMEAAFRGIFEGDDYELNIKQAYKICSEELISKTREFKISISDFSKYFYEYVKILRVPLPDGTDLNHYFEIMNSRGEQLEKHEVLKAKLMKYFNSYDKEQRDNYASCFDLVWESCSNMEKYVQYGFSPDQRHLIFGENNWNTLSVYSFDELVEKISSTVTIYENSTDASVDEIILERLVPKKAEDKTDVPDRFNSVVNFQNFLLHVLRVQTANNNVALDDKRLINVFDSVFPQKEEEQIAFVKQFIFNLLKCKFLFDKYIIKREFTANTDRWSLKSLRLYPLSKVKNSVNYPNTFGDPQIESFESDNRKILMLLSMFHVSLPSMAYKHWLNAALNYLFHETDVDSHDYIVYLEHIAKSFVFDNYLAKSPEDYFQMIYLSKQIKERNSQQLDLNKLCYGKIENILIFNFLDYLLWLKLKDTEKDSRIKPFEYTFRSSVEHYYPQVPYNSDLIKIDSSHLHSFGNLCLISHEKNSKLNNNSPIAKKDHYHTKATLDSLKQYLMMKYDQWTTSEIEIHGNEMVDLLLTNLNSSYNFNNEISQAKKWFKEFQVRDRILLVQALLCFGDCTKYVSGNKFNLFDFEYIKTHETFKYFEQYIEENKPNNLQEIIDVFLKDEKLKNDYRYLFINYPYAIDYCKEGNFEWKEETNGKLIYLLGSYQRTKRQGKEFYIFILQNFLQLKTGLQFYSDYDCLYIRISFLDDKYIIVDRYSDCALELKIWNKEGLSFEHGLAALQNGNARSIKSLLDYNWIKNESGEYERFGRSKICTISENCEENISNLKESVLKLFKNGLDIKL